MQQRGKLIGRIDPNDIPFVALSLAVENDGIWSSDKHFRQMKGVTVWKTSDLLVYLKKR
jgi:predicted nucleic acid-binding protein